MKSKNHFRPQLLICSSLLSLLVLNKASFAAELCSSVFAEPLSIALRYGNIINTYRPLMESQVPVAEKNKATIQKALAVHTLLKETFYPVVKTLQSEVFLLDENSIRQHLNAVTTKNPINVTEFTKREIQFDGHNYPAFFALPEPTKLQGYSAKLVDLNVNTGYKNYQFHLNDKMQPAKTFLWVKPSPMNVEKFGHLHLQLGLIVTPHGEYGLKFAKDLLRTTEILTEILTENAKIGKMSQEIFKENSILLTNETARGKFHGSEAGRSELVPVSAFVEGILSFHQLVSTLLAKKIPGIDSGEKALHEIIFNGGDPQLGLIAETTSRFPMGVIGPMAHAGLHFKKPLVVNEKGRVELAPEVKESLKELVLKRGKKSRCPMASLWSKIRPGSGESSDSISKGLDKTADKAGLQMLAETYWKIFSIVNKANPE